MNNKDKQEEYEQALKDVDKRLIKLGNINPFLKVDFDSDESSSIFSQSDDSRQGYKLTGSQNLNQFYN